MKPSTDFLKRTILFADVSDEHLRRVASEMQYRRFQEGQTIFREGSRGHALFIVGDGEVKISVTSPTGRDITLRLLYEAEVFGEMALLAGSTNRSATATATEDTEAWELNREAFERILDDEPSIARGILGGLSSIIRDMNEKLVDAAMGDAATRVAKVLLHMASVHGREEKEGLLITRELTREDIAGMAGMYTSSAERVLEGWELRNDITYESGTWLLRRPEVICRAAGRPEGECP